jgi:hypothetical protein
MSTPAKERTASPKITAPPILSHDAIARRAYNLFLSRHAEHGHDLDDWLQAERELRSPARSPRKR